MPTDPDSGYRLSQDATGHGDAIWHTQHSSTRPEDNVTHRHLRRRNPRLRVGCHVRMTALVCGDVGAAGSMV